MFVKTKQNFTLHERRWKLLNSGLALNQWHVAAFKCPTFSAVVRFVSHCTWFPSSCALGLQVRHIDFLLLLANVGIFFFCFSYITFVYPKKESSSINLFKSAKILAKAHLLLCFVKAWLWLKNPSRHIREFRSCFVIVFEEQVCHTHTNTKNTHCLLT